MVWTSFPVRRIAGAVAAPGDKSCSHRAFILGALAKGSSRFSGILEGDDVLRTAHAMRALGADVTQTGPGRWRIDGCGGFEQPTRPLDFGNSGTGSRLTIGAVAGYPIEVEMCGDASLSSRPMARILDPLRQMGLEVLRAARGDRLPVQLRGANPLAAIDYGLPKASAQVKSAILFAGLRADGVTTVREQRDTRDHTERMLRACGVAVDVVRSPGEGRAISVSGGQRLSPIEASIPGDPSSAAFLATAAIISPDGDVLIERVMSNDTRSGFFDVVGARMGATLGAEDAGEACGERTINLQVASGGLNGTRVPTTVVPAMIDEFPILAVVAAFADGDTLVSGADELRVKETDRITATVDMLRACGVVAEERPDGFVVQGCGGAPPGGGIVETRHDHRIAMSALVMGTASRSPVAVDDVSMIATSYPDFLAHMGSLGADIRNVAR